MAIPVKGKPMDFQIVREVWSTYTVKDKLPVQLKGRVILIKVLKTETFNALGEPIYGTGTANPIVVTIAPPELAGPPTIPVPTQETLSKAELIELEFERLEEPWNEYRLADGTTVNVRLVMNSVRRTPFFGMDGDPLYTVGNDVNTHLSIPKELRRK